MNRSIANVNEFALKETLKRVVGFEKVLTL